MRRGPHPAAWLPPFLAGVAAAMAAEASTGLLLYAGAGFLRALTVLLVTILGSLAFGLWSVPGVITAPVEMVRRRWYLALIAFVGAGAMSLVWDQAEGLTGTIERGAGLAILVALPMYATGHLLGAIATVRGSRGLRGPGAPAALGAAAGVVVTGSFLPRAATPVLLYGLGLVLIWMAAIFHGRVLDRTLRGDEHPVIDVRLLAPDEIDVGGR